MLRDSRKKIERNKDIRLERERERENYYNLPGRCECRGGVFPLG